MATLRESDRQLLEKACASSQEWKNLEALLSHHSENELIQFLENFYKQVDQSDFSLSDWIEAMLTFDQWMNEKKIPLRPVANMVSYIHCCTLTLADTLGPPNLAQVTGKMLDQHGFDAATDASPEPEV